MKNNYKSLANGIIDITMDIEMKDNTIDYNDCDWFEPIPEEYEIKVKKSDFDKRICDVGPEATNTETYREFIINSIHHFYGENANIPNFDTMTEIEINEIIEDFDYLWEK